MSEIQRRKIELEFYITIQLIYSIKRDADFLVTMLEGLRFIVDFNIEKIINYANRFNLDITWQPYKGEVVGLLYKYSDIPMNAICSALDISRATGYKLANTYIKDPYETPPRVPQEDLQDLQNVTEAYQILRGAIRNNA